MTVGRPRPRRALAALPALLLLFERKDLSVIVRDGGLPGHWGLPGTGERAERLGASMRWTSASASGQGSEMRLRLPGTLLTIV